LAEVARIIFGLAVGVPGIGSFICAVEGTFTLSCVFLVSAVFAVWFKSILIKNASGTLDRILHSGDIVWFLAVPGILLWKLFLSDYGIIGPAVLFIYMTAGLIRHSRNRGLHLIPVSGLIVSVIMLILGSGSEYVQYYKLVAILVLFVSYLMVADIEYSFESRKTLPHLAVAAAALGLGLWRIYFLTVLFSVYIFYGIYRETRKWIK
jgi:phosphatidylserine synthase